MKIKNNTFSASITKSLIGNTGFLNFACCKRIYITILIIIFYSVTIHPSSNNNHRMNNSNDKLLSNPSEWIICGPTSWEDLKNYLPEAKIAGVSVSVVLLPPVQTTPVCSQGAYSEPYGLDYIRWAQEIASLSLRYSNLTEFGIYELRENLNLGYLRPSYIDSIITAAKSINPRLQFISPHKNFYVDRDATGTGDGTSWANASTSLRFFPWDSINAGDTVYVSGGTDSTVYYNTASILNNINRVGSEPHIVVTKSWESGHNGDVYFMSSGNPGEAYALRVTGSYIKLSNLIMTTTREGTTGSKVLYIDGYGSSVSNIIVDNCTITSNGNANLIRMEEATHITITNSYLELLPNSSVNAYQDIIMMTGGGGGHTLMNNSMYYGGGLGEGHKDFIQSNQTGSVNNYETVIANNFFYVNNPYLYNFAHGIYYSEATGNRFLIYNNVFATTVDDVSLGGSEVISMGYISPGPISLRILNNTFISGQTRTTGIMLYTGIDTLVIKNNIMVRDSGLASGTDLQTVQNYFSSIDYVDINYNHYWNNGSVPTSFKDSLQTKTWAQWQALGYDANSDTGSVTFANKWGTAIADYVTTTGRDAGVDLSVYFTTDILGNTRSNWSMGAIEQ